MIHLSLIFCFIFNLLTCVGIIRNCDMSYCSCLGVGGAEGDGDVFSPENQAEFINFVKENTDGKGVHFVMADGVGFQNNFSELSEFITDAKGLN